MGWYIPDIEWEEDGYIKRRVLTELEPESFDYSVPNKYTFKAIDWAIMHLERQYVYSHDDRNIMFIRQSTVWDGENSTDSIQIGLHRIEEKKNYPQKIDGFKINYV